MKFTAHRPFADPDIAARRLMQHAHAFEPVHDGRIYIERLNGPFLFKGTPAEYAAGLDRAIALGWITLHDSGTFVKFTQSGTDVFARRGDRDPVATMMRRRNTCHESW